jgi:hypothetical protein
MPAIRVPDPLPPAITLPREVIEFAVSQHLEEFGESSLVARTWRWVLHGGGPGPISHMDWSEFDGTGRHQDRHWQPRAPPISRQCLPARQ